VLSRDKCVRVASASGTDTHPCAGTTVGKGGNPSYIAADRSTSGGGQTYSWDDNGNLLSDGVRTYSYDHANRLRQVTEGSLTTQFAYNADGVRVAKTIGAATTDYLVDLASTLPVVISDTDAVYLYGLDIIAEQLAGADRYYYVHDGLGSVRQLLDSSGQIATRYAYDPFGGPLAGNGVPNPWQFTGEAWDAEVGLLYLRARYYQPETGRFITKDPWAGNVRRPGTLNRYVYVGNNPVNLADPGGLQGPTPVPSPVPRPVPTGPQQPTPSSTPGPTPSPTGAPEPSAVPTPETGSIPRSGPSWGEPPRPSALSQLGDLFLIVLPDRYNSFQDLRFYSEYGYSRRASRNLAYMMVASWFFELGPEEQHFGSAHSLTQDVKHSSAVKQFRAQWETDAWLNNSGWYALPFTWYGHRVDSTSGNLIGRVVVSWSKFAYAQYTLGMCVIGQGSQMAHEPIDVVMGILGSFDDISVYDIGSGLVKFVVHNSMGRASLSRIPGTGIKLLKDVPRSKWWQGFRWGGTIHQYFHWTEENPNGPARSYPFAR
jgi:RHS repeat-associated protein